MRTILAAAALAATITNANADCVADDLRLLAVAESAMFEAIAIDRVRIENGGDRAESFDRVRDATVLALMDFMEVADQTGLALLRECGR